MHTTKCHKLLGWITIREKYTLHGFTKQDFKNEYLFFTTTCALCGHHVLKTQGVFIDGHCVHNDVAICLELIKQSGIKQTEPHRLLHSSITHIEKDILGEDECGFVD